MKSSSRIMAECVRNTHLPFGVLRVLTDNKIIWARNSTVPYEMFEELVRDYRWTYIAVARNHKAPADILSKLAQDDDDIAVREAVASNPSTPVEVLRALVEDKNEEWDVRRSVAANPSTPVGVLEKLMKDQDMAVRYWASARVYGSVDKYSAFGV